MEPIDCKLNRLDRESTEEIMGATLGGLNERGLHSAIQALLTAMYRSAVRGCPLEQVIREELIDPSRRRCCTFTATLFAT